MPGEHKIFRHLRFWIQANHRAKIPTCFVINSKQWKDYYI